MGAGGAPDSETMLAHILGACRLRPQPNTVKKKSIKSGIFKINNGKKLLVILCIKMQKLS
jgi:hypothetical protein